MRGQNAKGAEVAQKSQKKYQKCCLGVFSVFCGVFAFFAFFAYQYGGRTQRTQRAQRLRRGRRKIANILGLCGCNASPSSFPRRRESMQPQRRTWIPACAGMTLFYRAVRVTVGSAFFCANPLQHQPVAHARFSQQMLGAGGVKLQFAAQVGHVNAQVVRVFGVVGAPYFA